MLRKELKETEFSKKVRAWVLRIPKGKVATYGQIARLAGKPHAARGVGWILNACAEKYALPWQRVINSKGKISFNRKSAEYTEQQTLLRREGVEVSRAGEIDLAGFQWSKKPARVKAQPGVPKMFSE